MDVVTLIIAVVALLIAIMAFQRTGGMKELRHRVDALNSSESLRDRTADVLNRVERFIRGKDKPTEEKGDDSSESSKPSEP